MAPPTINPLKVLYIKLLAGCLFPGATPLAARYAYSTVKKAYDTLNECFRQAAEDGVLWKNPCNKNNKPKESDFINLDEDDDVRVLSDAEIERFCKEALRTYSNGNPAYLLG